MQKVVQFLEAKVEWVALAVACLFLGYSAYTYLLSQPVSQKIGVETVTPGNVDAYIDEHQAADIHRRMAETTVPEFKVQQFDEAVTRGLSLDGLMPDQLASTAIDYAPFDPAVINTNPAAQQAVITQLPNLPKALPLLVAAGLDTLAPGPGGVPPARDAKVTLCAFSIPWSSLAGEFNKCFGPLPGASVPRLLNADIVILKVTTYRNEKDSSGQWGPDVEIPPSPNGLPPFPPAGNKAAESAYETAVSKQPAVIIAPKIPETTAGAKWSDPLTLFTSGGNNNTAPTGFPAGSPTAPPSLSPSNSRESPDSLRLLTPENTHYFEMAGPAAPGVPPYGKVPPPPAGRAFPLPPPANPQAALAPAPIAPPVVRPAPAAAPTVFAPGTAFPIVVFANAGGAAPSPMPVEPTAKLNPAALPANSPDIALYIVDTTAKSGRTYRYHIVYTLLNPLFLKNPQRAQNPAWTNQFDLVSPLSADSPEITIPVQTYLFCGKGVGKNSVFPFEVITWAAGLWHKNTFNASPGDPIGGMDNDIDYSTGYSYAGLKTARGKTSVTLMDDRGEGEIRDAAKDFASPEHKEKSTWVEPPPGSEGQPLATTPLNPALPGGGGPKPPVDSGAGRE